MREGRNTALMRTAFVWAEQSTCDRLHVGAVIAKGGRILVQGYNGAPSGLPHCDHACDCPTTRNIEMYGHGNGCKSGPDGCLAVHAEQNAIAWAAKVGVSLDGSFMAVTHQPCLSCARSIINAGIKQVRYALPYRLTDGVELLASAGVEVHCHTAGMPGKVIE